MIDASAMVELIVEGRYAAATRQFWLDQIELPEDLLAPSHMPVEVTNAFRRMVVAGGSKRATRRAR